MKFSLILIIFLIEKVVCADDEAKSKKSSGRVEYHEAKRTEHQNYFKSVMTSLGELSKAGTNQNVKIQSTSGLNSVAKYFNKKVLKHNEIIKDIHSGNKIEGEKTVEHITKKRKLNSGQTSNLQVGTSETHSSP